MDIEELDEDLGELAGDSNRRDKLQRDLVAIDVELRAAEAARERWQRLAAEAGEDLAALEGMTLTALFRRLLGDRDERIAEERKVLLHAKLKHDEAEAAVAPLVAERDAVRRELRSLGDLEARRAALLQQKEALLQARGGEVAQQLTDSAMAVGTLRAAAREIGEAISAGRQAEAALDVAYAELVAARSWGRMDMLGGGMMVSLAKHSRIDKAQAAVERAQRHLRTFARELQDVDAASPGIDVRVDPFVRFADTFFDSLLMDWLTQSRIGESLQRVEATRAAVRERLWGLERRGKATREALGAAEGERRRQVEDSR